MYCSPDTNAEMFAATIGGLGLTGLITWMELQLRPVEGPMLREESLKFFNLDEFFRLSDFDADMAPALASPDMGVEADVSTPGIAVGGTRDVDLVRIKDYRNRKQQSRFTGFETQPSCPSTFSKPHS